MNSCIVTMCGYLHVDILMKFATHSDLPPDDAAFTMLMFMLTYTRNYLYTMQVYFTFVLHTGDVMLERISPRIIVLDPPEKLVIETRASGGYWLFDWQRYANPFGTSSFLVTLQEFPNFLEIFVRVPTNASDLGVYEVEIGPEVDFTVTPYSEYMYVISCVVFEARFLFTVYCHYMSNHTEIFIFICLSFHGWNAKLMLHFPDGAA